MNESDQYKDGGSDGQYTRQDEGRYDDEPEGKREDEDKPCNKTIITASDNCVCGLPKSQHKAQPAPAHTPVTHSDVVMDLIAQYDELERELAETRAACDALADVVRTLVDYGTAPMSQARAALAQWKEAKK